MGAGASSDGQPQQGSNGAPPPPSNAPPAAAAAGHPPPPQSNPPQQANPTGRQQQQQPPPPSTNTQNNLPPSSGAKPPPPRNDADEDERDALEWQREQQRLEAKLKEKREKEQQQQQQQQQQQAPPPPAGAPPPAGGGADASQSPADGKQQKKKKLLNGSNIEYRYPSGSTYVGGFKDGKLHGFGRYHYHPSGDEYEGEWLADMKHGQGTYTYEGGDRYSGEWRAGKKHGKGTYLFATGDEYTGSWKDDKIHGFGVFSIARNGNRYEGAWEESYRHGQGKLYSGTGDVYDGQWMKGKEDGLGVLTYANGNVYAGEWKTGQMDGKGILKEKSQKFTVEHIAGYLIAKVPVEPEQEVDPDWNAANRLYRSATGGGARATSPNGTAGGAGGAQLSGVDAAQLTKLKNEKEMWEKKYLDLIEKQRKVDSTGSQQLEGTNDVATLKKMVAELREQRDGEKLRADEFESRERVLRAEIEELNFVADNLRKEMAVKRGESDSIEVEKLQRRCAELEREIAARKAGPSSNGREDPVELKVRLELVEGELKNLRATRDEVYKLREQNLDSLKTIQSLELRNEELIKEMNLQRAKASNLQSQITESTSRGAREAQDEINVLRADLADTQQKLAQSEDRLKKQKKNQENLELRARRADDLEAEVLRLTKLKTGDAELNKNLDKKMDQLDSLRKQNAELQRQLEELQHEYQSSQQTAAASGGKKGKKNKKGEEAQDEVSGAGGSELVEQLQADLKKEKKKHKKAAADRDALAQELFDEQVKLARFERTLQNFHGRVNVIAKVRENLPHEHRSDNPVVSVNHDDPSQIVVLDQGSPIAFQFDTCLGPESTPADLFEELKLPISQVPDGFHSGYVFVGPMQSGKTSTMQSLIPLITEELYNQITQRQHQSYEVMVEVGCAEITADGAFDCASGAPISAVLQNPQSCVTPVGVTFVGCANPVDASSKIKAIIAKRQKKNGRSHLWIQLRTEIVHKVQRSRLQGRLTMVDLCGPGALSNQEDDVTSGKFANRAFQSLGVVVEALQANSQTVPYLDSLSTTFLADLLGGNCMTTVVACLSSSEEQLPDSMQTLQTANRATNIFNRPLLQSFTSVEENRLRELVLNLSSEEQAQTTLTEISTLR